MSERLGPFPLSMLPAIENHTLSCRLGEECDLIGIRNLMRDMDATRNTVAHVPVGRLAAVAELLRPYVASPQVAWLAAGAVLRGDWVQEWASEVARDVRLRAERDVLSAEPSTMLSLAMREGAKVGLEQAAIIVRGDA